MRTASEFGRFWSWRGAAICGLGLVAGLGLAGLAVHDVVVVGHRPRLYPVLGSLAAIGIALALVPALAFPRGCRRCAVKLAFVEAVFPATSFERVAQVFGAPTRAALADLEPEKLRETAQTRAAVRLHFCPRCRAVATGGVEAQSWQGQWYETTREGPRFELSGDVAAAAIDLAGIAPDWRG